MGDFESFICDDEIQNSKKARSAEFHNITFRANRGRPRPREKKLIVVISSQEVAAQLACKPLSTFR